MLLTPCTYKPRQCNYKNIFLLCITRGGYQGLYTYLVGTNASFHPTVTTMPILEVFTSVPKEKVTPEVLTGLSKLLSEMLGKSEEVRNGTFFYIAEK